MHFKLKSYTVKAIGADNLVYYIPKEEMMMRIINTETISYVSKIMDAKE